MKLKIRILTIALTLLGNSAGYASLRVPKGFEELAQGQIVLTEVSVYGHSLGMFKSRVDLESIQFLQPQSLASEINNIYQGSESLKKLLQNSLNKRFLRNGGLSCSANGGAPGCDYLDTDTIGVIYDESSAKVYLFLGKAYVPKKKNLSVYFEQNDNVRNALIHQQSINFVTDKNYQSASIQGNGSLGMTDNGYLNVDWTWLGQRSKFDSTQQIDINNAYFRQDLMHRYYLQAGVMDSRDIFSNAGGNINLSQLPLGKINGVRVGSTLSWFNMGKTSTGTPVSVFLSRDSRVDAYRDKQLLASFYLKAGSQELDSRAFPVGSYTVTLRIYENNQLIRTENIPYTRLGGVTPAISQWFLQAGVPDNDKQKRVYNEQHVVQGGVRFPLTDNLSLTGGAAVFSRAHYWEGAVDWSHGFDSGWIDGLMTSRASYLHGSEGSRGNIQQINYNDIFSLSFYRTAMTAPDCNVQSTHRFSFNGCYKSTNIMLSVPFEQWYGTLGYGMNTNEGRYVYRRDMLKDNIDYKTSQPWETIYQTRSKSRTWQIGINRTFSINGMNINSSLNTFFRNDSGFNGTDKGVFVTFSLFKARNEIGGSRSSYSIGANWQASKNGRSQLGYNVDYNRYTDDSGENEVGASLSGINTDTLSSSLYGRVGGQYGNGMLVVSDTWDKIGKENLLSASGNYNSSLIIDKKGAAFGRWGDGTPSSALTVSVKQKDSSSKSRVNVSLDGGGKSDIQGNSRAVFTVPGYRETTFNVTESSKSPDGISSEIDKGIGQRKVFMVPGKVFNRDVEVSTRYTWLGKLMDEHHVPLEGVMPLNIMSWTPLGNGSFTMDTDRKIDRLYVTKNNMFWQCGMKVDFIRDVIHYVGASACHITTLANLPHAERKQIELMTADRKSQFKQTVMNN